MAHAKVEEMALRLALAVEGSIDIVRVPLRRLLKSPAAIPAAIEEIAGRFSEGAPRE